MVIPSSIFDPLRALVAATSPDVFTIVRTPLVADGMGGSTPGTPTTTTGNCRVAPLGQNTPQEREYAERFTGETLWTITLPAGTDVTNQDQITVGALTYEVIGVLGPRSYEVRRRVICRKLT